MSEPKTDLQGAQTNNILRVMLSVCAIVIIAYLFTSTRVDETLATVMTASLLLSLVVGVTSRAACFAWPVVAIGLAMGIVERPLDVPNHHWMMTYLSSAISLCMLGCRDQATQVESLSFNARALLIVLMGFATVQKLLSPDFLDGSYIGFELARGGFGGPLLKLVPETHAIVTSNAELVETLHTTPPSDLNAVKLEPPFPAFTAITYGFTASILLMELWLCLSMLLIPKRAITHLSLIAFIITLAGLRQEFTFISVVCAMGLMACGSESKIFRVTYAGLAVVIASAVLKTLNLS